MDGHHGSAQPERLEDQLRRMILSGQPNPPNPSNMMPQTNHEFQRPVVRLPPSPHHHGLPSPQHFAPPPDGPWNPPPSGMPTGEQFHGPPNMMSGPHERLADGSHGGHGHHHHYHHPSQDQRFDWPPHTRERGHFHGHFGHRGRGHPGSTHHQMRANGQQHPHAPHFAPHHLTQRARHQQSLSLDPDAFQRTAADSRFYHGPGPRNLFDPSQRGQPMNPVTLERETRQAQYLGVLAEAQIRDTEMSKEEHDEKDSFRVTLQAILHEVCAANSDRLPEVSLECFGSFRSGFASKGSDMDLVIVVKGNSSIPACFSMLEEDLPRVLEKRLLDLDYGARLLSKTRVPIIKICEKPGQTLLDNLRDEREKWQALPEKEKYPHLHPKQDEEAEADGQETEDADPSTPATKTRSAADDEENKGTSDKQISNEPVVDGHKEPGATNAAPTTSVNSPGQRRRDRGGQKWTRQRKSGPLDFPPEGVGIQCDINFFNPLGLHNTQMLRCYSLCDPRVRPMILFIKAWAKRRKINSSYSGTLSSYGYVLMVLHYLVNVAKPPVLPNLQNSWRPPGYENTTASSGEEVNGWHVQFWSDEAAIQSAAQNRLLMSNTQSLGSLIAGFFQYFASQLQGGPQYRWVHDVLSLRSASGLITKHEKGWVKAVTEQNDGRKVQQRYLFCIEDPFELNHNVARTVTHFGLVAIRDEFRRARRILHAVGLGYAPRDGELFAKIVEVEDLEVSPTQLKAEISPGGTGANPTADDAEAVKAGGAIGGQEQGPEHKADQTMDVKDDSGFPSLAPPPSHDGPQNRGKGSHRGGRGEGRGEGRGNGGGRGRGEGRGRGRGGGRGRGRGRGAGTGEPQVSAVSPPQPDGTS